jgi:four helix bundle protein
MARSSFRDVLAWQKAMELTEATYRASESFPARENFGLSQQIQRAAVSVASNIAEGRGRGGRRDYRQFLLQARGSACEVQTQILVAVALRYLEGERGDESVALTEEVIRLISGLIRYLDERI